jgi:hypothetical protein
LQKSIKYSWRKHCNSTMQDTYSRYICDLNIIIFKYLSANLKGQLLPKINGLNFLLRVKCHITEIFFMGYVDSAYDGHNLCNSYQINLVLLYFNV